jgi:hypothetical protein
VASFEKIHVPLWGASVANSAVLLSAEGGKVRGLLVEQDSGLRFRAAGESSPRFEAPWATVEGVRLPWPSAKGVTVVAAGHRHRLRLTDAVIDKTGDAVPDGSAPDEFPIEGGTMPTNITREEALMHDVGTAVGGLTLVVNFLAADRVRRRRVRKRILERAGKA